jgi:hypothetical protein
MNDPEISKYMSQLPSANSANDEVKVEEANPSPYPYYARKDTLRVQNAFLVGNWTPTSGFGCRNPGRMAILISHIQEITDIAPCDGGSTLVKCELKNSPKP